jgi:hypothetical protein
VKSWLSLLLALLLPVALIAAPEDADDQKTDQKAAGEGKKKPKETPKGSSEDKKESEILRNIPDDQTYHDVTIPNMGPGGKLLSRLKAKKVKRLNDRNFEMGDLTVEIFNKDGSTFHVQMPHSVFNIDTRILTSDTPTTIRRDDFTINGDKAEFHIKEKFGRVIGNVKMVIFNTGNTK